MRLSQTLNIALALIDKATSNNVQLKLIGLIGIVALVKEKEGFVYIKNRKAKDIDFIIENRANMLDIIRIFQTENYELDKEVFLFSEGNRGVFMHKNNLIVIDVIVNPFRFSHKVDFTGRFDIEKYTLSATDLLLTKLQRVKIRSEDFSDIESLLYSFDITENQEKQICLKRLSDLIWQDWEIYHTIMKNLHKLSNKTESVSIRNKICKIEDSLKNYPKSIFWRIRSLFGEAIKHYEIVDKS